MNPCNNNALQSELKAYLDGQLPLMLRQRVRRHLRSCAACREELSAMEKISHELRADGPKPLESSLRDRILNAVSNSHAEAPPAAPDSPQTASRWRRKPLLIWGGVATALVAWFILYPVFNGGLRQYAPALQRQVAAKSDVAGGPVPTSSASSAAMPHTQDYDETKSVTADQGRAGGQALVNAPAAATPPAPPVGFADGHAKAAAPLVQYGTPAADRPEAQERAQRMKVMDLTDRATRVASPVHRVFKPNVAAAHGSLFTPADEEKVERQVHHTAVLTVQVDNVEAKSDTAAQYVQTAGGYVASNELNTGEDDLKTASLTLKVPVAQFETVLNQIARLGEVKAKNITGEDLTEKISDQEQSEHVLRQDIDTTQQELTQRLSKSARQERMDTLRELRTRIAQTKARLTLLKKLGALSDITLQLTEKPHSAPAPKTGGFVDDMNDALHGAVHSMMQAARLPILTFIWILAYSPLWILLILGYRYAIRR